MKKAVKMLDEVKESIMNAYEIKTGLARDKISKLMDAESWFNAKKAVELGFADKILFADGQGDVTNDAGEGMVVSDDMSAPVMFSRQAVMNSMLSKLIPLKKPAEKRTPVDQLEKRLSLLHHGGKLGKAGKTLASKSSSKQSKSKAGTTLANHKAKCH